MARQGEPREAPVSFRPGKLRPALRQRALRNATEGQIAKRDLARFYLLLGGILLDDRLTRREASWLAQAAFKKDVDDTLYGGPFVPEHVDPSRELLAIVEHSTRDAERHGKQPTDIALRVQRKIDAMAPLERAALLDAIDRLPAENEEEIGDPGHWAFIGVRLADEPVAISETSEPT
jgi:hypothetical protein